MPIPPHRGIELPGLHAYAGQISVAAGDSIGFHVSSTASYSFKVCRVGPNADDPELDPVIHDAGDLFPPRSQPIHPGSYVAIERGLSQQDAASGFSIEIWIKPWGFGAAQTIVSQFDDHVGAGFALGIVPTGCIEFRYMESGVRSPALSLASAPLEPQQWVHVIVSVASKETNLFLNGDLVASTLGVMDRLPIAPMLIGAIAQGGQADHFLDADIVMPVLYGGSLTQPEAQARYAERGLRPPSNSRLLACWLLNEETGDRISDSSGNARHGRIINHGTWMIVGPAFDGSKVPRFLPSKFPYDPSFDASRGHGLRLASDDLVDCRWSECHKVEIPKNARSGIYVGRFEFMLDGQAIKYDTTFVVTRAPDRPHAKILVLCATNTWRAYASSPFARNVPGAAQWPRRAEPLPNSHPEAPAFNHYTTHRRGQPTYYAGLRMPWPSAAPDAFYAPDGAGFSHGPRLERCLHTWLDSQGYDFDVASDLDIHRNPELMGHYDVVIVNGHSEYWSAPALDGLESYLNKGGNLIVLSGNTMYWRVSFDDECTVMEQRKTLTPNDPDQAVENKHTAPGGSHGEQYHSQDGMRGGLWRFNDRSCSALIGLETGGWAFAEPGDFGVYRVTDETHFLFHVPEKIGLRVGDTFGHAPDGALPRAIGHEWDMTISTLELMTRNRPTDGELPPNPAGVHVLAQGVRVVPGKLDAYMDFFEGATESLNGLSAEMIYWARPQGGCVFNAGSVGASWVLGVDEVFGKLVRNVLYRFGVRPA